MKKKLPALALGAKPIVIKIDLGPVQLRPTFGDVDKNGCFDFSMPVRIVGLIEVAVPPINLDAALIQGAIEFFQALAKKGR
jgi:hypothetical protein